MKWVKRLLLALLLMPIMLAVLWVVALSFHIPGKDVIECGLPDGSKFRYVSTYEWYPFVRYIPADVSKRLNRSGFVSYYITADGKKTIQAGGGTHVRHDYTDPKVAMSYCAPMGIVNGVPFTLINKYKVPNNDYFTSVTFNRDLFVPPEPDSNPPQQVQETPERRDFFAPVYKPAPRTPPHIRESLEQLDATFSSAAFIWRPGKLVLESAVYKKNSFPELVIAAYRIESLDGGKTWGNPHITYEPEVVEIGKPVRSGCFYAQLIRIDSRKFESDFPPCPIALSLPERAP